MPEGFTPDPTLAKQPIPNGFTPDKSLSFSQSQQALGHSTGILGTVLSTGGAIAGGIGGAMGGAAIGGPVGAYAGGVAGSGLGGAGGEALAEGIEKQPLQPGAIAKTGGINAAFDAIGGPILSAGGKLLEGVGKPIISAIGKGASKMGEMLGGKAPAQLAEQGVKAADEVIRPPAKLATKRLASTADNMTKGEREQAIKEGRMTTSGKFTPSKTEQRAGEIMKGKTYSNPVKTTKAVQDEIKTRGGEAETYLETNSKKISNQEDADAFQSARASSEKYMTPSETSAYDEQIGVFQKILKSYTGAADGGYNTANYYKALKDYESQVTANLPKGKDALLTPGGSARIQGAKDVRNVVRDMIGEKNPEFKGKMYDLASLYNSLDNVVSNAEKGGFSLAKRYPKTSTAIGTAATIGGYEELKKLPIIGDLLP